MLGVRGHKHISISNGKTMQTSGGVFSPRGDPQTVMRNDKSSNKSHIMSSSKDGAVFSEGQPTRNMVTLEPVSR